VTLDLLSEVATGRSEDLFREDLERCEAAIRERIGGRRLLVIGGAGSIGAATVGLIVGFHPESLHVVDQNENALAELVRDLRSRTGEFSVRDFQTLPIDFGSPIMLRFLRCQQPYDLVLNFAALKHVRSEKDTCSLLQILDTNILKAFRFLRWLRETGSGDCYFGVSTDKAANPVNLMGASKRAMEHLLFSEEGPLPDAKSVTSARFANVGFSDGSLLFSFVKRFEKHQPLACPRNTRRFFISLHEAAEICVLASTCGPHRHIVVPKLSPGCDRALEDIAVAFLRRHGFRPKPYENQSECKAGLTEDVRNGQYPILLTELDTTGEKQHEEFVSAGEEAVEFGMRSLQVVRYRPAPSGALPEFLRAVEDLIVNPETYAAKEDVVELMKNVVGELQHSERTRNLDQRM
jgi:FlaA1/EpsC-like NDP-sugar epimerase